MTTNARLLQGSLRDFGLVEILQMMELGGMTGALRLKQFSGRVGIIYFSEGKLASCSELDEGALTLGDVLQQLRMARTRLSLKSCESPWKWFAIVMSGSTCANFCLIPSLRPCRWPRQFHMP